MSTKTTTQTEDRAAIRIAATLPTDEPSLIEIARAAADDYDRAVMAADDTAATAAHERYDAAVYRLNGDSFFGCRADDEAAGGRLGAACAAVDGQVPRWGQRGRFVITVQSMRVLVEFRPVLDCWAHHFELRIVDRTRPFISPTGYQSIFVRHLVGGLTTEATAMQLVAERIAEHGTVRLGEQVQRRPTDDEDNEDELLDGLPPPPPEVSADGQLGFGF